MNMPNWILFLRGINVGGKHLLPMKELVPILWTFGFENIRTYIQSGNVVFQSSEEIPPGMGDTIAAEIESRKGFRPQVLLLNETRLKAAIRQNPFPEAEKAPKTLHLFFLVSRPEEPDLDTLNQVKAPDERFALSGEVFYLHAPGGIGRSKLAASVEKCLGVQATARNWRTVEKLWEIVQAG
jgi:uncharacterized protein (DUF1697 family)